MSGNLDGGGTPIPRTPEMAMEATVMWEVGDAGPTIAYGTGMSAFEASSLICTAESDRASEL